MQPQCLCNFLLIFSLLLAINFITFGYARIFEKCRLAEKLLANGFSVTEIRTTLCYSDLSGYDNWFMVTVENGTFYGLFGIQEPWCASNIQIISDSACNELCRTMMDDHLSNDMICLRKMYDGNGRWSQEFKQFYLENNLKDMVLCEQTIMDGCNLLETNRVSSFTSPTEC